MEKLIIKKIDKILTESGLIYSMKNEITYECDDNLIGGWGTPSISLSWSLFENIEGKLFLRSTFALIILVKFL